MSKGRLEAFSDGVIAILITIMVLELKIPHEDGLEALLPILPVFLSYALSFIFLGIYWNNHHHLFQAARAVDGRVLWANLHLLFWLSLIPFGTGWMGENEFATLPVAFYGGLLFMSGLAYYLLTRALLKLHPADTPLSRAVRRDVKGWVTLVLLVLAIPLAFANRWVACGIFVLVALIWFIPDRRIERSLESHH